jgi:GT2 family glycosyltransferase
MKDMDATMPMPCDWVVGACMLIRKKVWDIVDGFDARYFLYYEDVDICRKVWRSGYQVWFYPNTHIIHYHKRLSAGKRWWLTLFDKTARIHIASHIKYFKKWGGNNVKLKNQSANFTF